MITRTLLETLNFQKEPATDHPCEVWVFPPQDISVCFGNDMDYTPYEYHSSTYDGDRIDEQVFFYLWLKAHDRQIRDSACIVFTELPRG